MDSLRFPLTMLVIVTICLVANRSRAIGRLLSNSGALFLLFLLIMSLNSLGPVGVM